MSGDEIREARERAGMTQADLAGRMGVSLRTIGNWERGENVPRGRMARIEDELGPFRREGGSAAPLVAASDVELLSELGRRLGVARRRESGVAPSGVAEGVDEMLAVIRGDIPSGSSSPAIAAELEHGIRQRELKRAPGIDDYDLAKLVARRMQQLQRLPAEALIAALYADPIDTSGDQDESGSAAPKSRAGGSPAPVTSFGRTDDVSEVDHTLAASEGGEDAAREFEGHEEQP